MDGKIISIPGGITDTQLGNPMEGGELDALFNASRQVEASLIRERANTARMKGELTSLQSRYTREFSQIQRQLQQFAARDEHQRKQLTAYHQHIEAVSAHVKKQEETIAALRSEQEELQKSYKHTLSTSNAALEHSKNHARGLELTVSQLRPRLDHTQGDLMRVQAEAQDREQKFRAAIQAHEDHRKTLEENLNGLKAALLRKQAELNQYKSAWVEAGRIKHEAEQSLKRQEEFQLKAQAMAEANRSLTERLAIEKRRREQADASAKSTDAEREMLISSLRASENRLMETSAELALLHAAQKAVTQRKIREFEGLDELAVMGYPVIRE